MHTRAYRHAYRHVHRLVSRPSHRHVYRPAHRHVYRPSHRHAPGHMYRHAVHATVEACWWDQHPLPQVNGPDINSHAWPHTEMLLSACLRLEQGCTKTPVTKRGSDAAATWASALKASELAWLRAATTSGCWHCHTRCAMESVAAPHNGQLVSATMYPASAALTRVQMPPVAAVATMCFMRAGSFFADFVRKAQRTMSKHNRMSSKSWVSIGYIFLPGRESLVDTQQRFAELQLQEFGRRQKEINFPAKVVDKNHELPYLPPNPWSSFSRIFESFLVSWHEDCIFCIINFQYLFIQRSCT